MEGINPYILAIAAIGFPFLWGYLFGSIPFGLIFTKMAGLGDVRDIGSGNIGATNVLRTGRKGLAVATLMADAAKGAIPIFLAASIMGTPAFGPTIAVGAFVGHLYPIWLSFKGGKGIAVFIGCLLAISPIAALVFAVFWLGAAAVFRYSSLGSLIASAVTPLMLLYLYSSNMLQIGQAAAIAFAVMAALAWYAHRTNISRLLSGTESKLGAKG